LCFFSNIVSSFHASSGDNDVTTRAAGSLLGAGVVARDDADEGVDARLLLRSVPGLWPRAEAVDVTEAERLPGLALVFLLLLLLLLLLVVVFGLLLVVVWFAN